MISREAREKAVQAVAESNFQFQSMRGDVFSNLDSEVQEAYRSEASAAIDVLDDLGWTSEEEPHKKGHWIVALAEDMHFPEATGGKTASEGWDHASSEERRQELLRLARAAVAAGWAPAADIREEDAEGILFLRDLWMKSFDRLCEELSVDKDDLTREAGNLLLQDANTADMLAKHIRTLPKYSRTIDALNANAKEYRDRPATPKRVRNRTFGGTAN